MSDDGMGEAGEQAAKAALNHQGAEGGDSMITAEDMEGPEEIGGPWNTTPDTPLNQMPDIWNPQEGGLRRILRGVSKWRGKSIGDGLPAVADLGIGAAEEAYKNREVLIGGDADDQEADAGTEADESFSHGAAEPDPEGDV